MLGKISINQRVFIGFGVILTILIGISDAARAFFAGLKGLPEC
jgi:hypothetical protein